MIHLCINSTDNESLCGAIITGGDVLTCAQPPHNREPKTLCQKCKTLYREEQEKLRVEDMRRYDDYFSSLSSKEKRKMKLEQEARLWEDQMGAMGYFLASVGTFGIAPMIVSFKKKWAAYRLAKEFPETLVPKPKFRCPECQTLLMDEVALANHKHPKSELFYCQDCDFECEMPNDLEDHYEDKKHGKI